MVDMFLYNWQIRDEWFEWCNKLQTEELTKRRVGGMGSILHNLYHVIDCEQIWINQLQGTPVLTTELKNVNTLQEAIAFSHPTQAMTRQFLESFSKQDPAQTLELKRKDGSVKLLSHEKVLKHIIAHEIHHIGQLSVWSRDMGIKPVSSDLIFRELI
ncbi:MAG: DinB family protein [Bacillota bacterium]